VQIVSARLAAIGKLALLRMVGDVPLEVCACPRREATR
jgi:hypothetical protein